MTQKLKKEYIRVKKIVDRSNNLKEPDWFNISEESLEELENYNNKI